MECFAAAKVNLALHVTGQRPDGFHTLDSLVVFASFGDRITLAKAATFNLEISGPYAADLAHDPNNLVLKAARLSAVAGAHIRLQKNLPVSSGIGGGSADAAATLNGLSQLYGTPLPDIKNQLALGADVPVCVNGKPVRMRGIGEDLTGLVNLPTLPCVLVNPGKALATPAVFSALKTKKNAGLDGQIAAMPREADAFFSWLETTRNDLQEPAISMVPEITKILSALSHLGARFCRLSGSGATVFGLFNSLPAAQAAAEKLAVSQPDWWSKATMLNG